MEYDSIAVMVTLYIRESMLQQKSPRTSLCPIVAECCICASAICTDLSTLWLSMHSIGIAVHALLILCILIRYGRNS